MKNRKDKSRKSIGSDLDKVFEDTAKSVKARRKANERNARKNADRKEIEADRRRKELKKVISQATATIRIIVQESRKVRTALIEALRNIAIHVVRESRTQRNHGILLINGLDSTEGVAIELLGTDGLNLIFVLITPNQESLEKIIHDRLAIVPVLKGHESAYGIVWRETANPSKKVLGLLKKLTDPTEAVHIMANNLA